MQGTQMPVLRSTPAPRQKPKDHQAQPWAEQQCLHVGIKHILLQGLFCDFLVLLSYANVICLMGW